ncbi:peptidase T [Saccharicrinis sp. FJH62]|uniref:peptidase T n=1 Tax=Saccharicrinis sp. FJH62 TaxID=3344657 RepID=UPI0035D46DB8
MSQVLERFLTYVKLDTQSDYETKLTPSTPGQMIFAEKLVKELKSIGLEEVSLDDNGYVMATLPSNIKEDIPVIGFVAHMDTSPDMTGKKVSPCIVSNYDGKEIILNAEENIILTPEDFPEILQYIGEDIVVTNGKTLLGADDKAGLAEIVTAMEFLIQHPEIKHGKIRIGFTPDEEIGAGADHFDVKKFGAEWAYTMDGGEIGELEFENFNAAFAKIYFKGRNVHPGYAKHKMRNSIRIANQFITLMPRFQTPEHTEDYEGFFHLMSMEGDVEKTTLQYIVRDHSRPRFEERKKEMIHMTNKINNEFGEGTCTIEMKDQYYNMREMIEPVMHIVDIAEQAMKNCGITPNIKPIRGGTDGARLSYMGLPCPNIFAGGHNFHGRFEYVPVGSMEKAVNVIVEIIDIVAKKSY